MEASIPDHITICSCLQCCMEATVISGGAMYLIPLPPAANPVFRPVK